MKSKKRKAKKKTGSRGLLTEPFAKEPQNEGKGGAPEGNQFWMLRSRHGRKKLFETPALMWEAACEYFQWCEENPFQRAEAKVTSNGGNSGSSVEITDVPVLRPFTIHGLCLYLNCNTQYFKTFKAQLPENEKDFNTVIRQIEEVIYNQKFSGAASGFFNANIIARDLGLKDNTDITTGGDKLPGNDFPDAIKNASLEQLKELINKGDGK